MEIVTVGRGRIGGGLAALWSKAGHEVVTLGRDGGDGSDADVVLVAVPGQSIAAALANVTGVTGKVTIDATNAYGQRQVGFPSLAAPGQVDHRRADRQELQHQLGGDL